jgi:hypothetical protein
VISPPSSQPAPAPAAEPRGGRAPVERFNPARIEQIELTPAMSARESVEMVTSRLAATEACAVVEHLFGVRSLLALFDRSDDTLADVASGSTPGALGLFTPSPEPGWGAVPLAGEWTAGALRVHGEVRVPGGGVGGVIVLVRVTGEELRLAWLDPRSDGVAQRDARSGEPARESASPCWLLVDDAAIEAGLVSRPVTLAPGGELFQRLEEYARIWALAAVHLSKRIVIALRRAARTTRRGGPAPFRDSQLVGMSLTEVEIEAELTAAAVARGTTAADPASHDSLVLALSAARTLASASALARQLRDQLGLPFDAWLADAIAPALTTYLGGTLMLENELARALGLGRSSVAEVP